MNGVSKYPMNIDIFLMFVLIINGTRGLFMFERVIKLSASGNLFEFSCNQYRVS